MRHIFVLLATLAALNTPARAAWLQCMATGLSASGTQSVYLSSVMPLDAARTHQPNDYQQRLRHYVAAQYPDTRNLTVSCINDADQLQANIRYENTYSDTARRFGWENTHIILPGDWLSHDWLINGESVP